MNARLSKNRIRTDIGTDARNVGKTQKVTKLKQKIFCLKGRKDGEVNDKDRVRDGYAERMS